MVGAAGFEPATPGPPGMRQATSADMTTKAACTNDARRSMGTHEGPRENAALARSYGQRSTFPLPSMSSALTPNTSAIAFLTARVWLRTSYNWTCVIGRRRR
jgi:hypothetical protein